MTCCSLTRTHLFLLTNKGNHIVCSMLFMPQRKLLYLTLFLSPSCILLFHSVLGTPSQERIYGQDYFLEHCSSYGIRIVPFHCFRFEYFVSFLLLRFLDLLYHSCYGSSLLLVFLALAQFRVVNSDSILLASSGTNGARELHSVITPASSKHD